MHWENGRGALGMALSSPTPRNSRSCLISLDLNFESHWTLTSERTLSETDATQDSGSEFCLLV